LRPNSWNIRVFFDALADSVFEFLHYLTILDFIFHKYLLSSIFVLSIKPEKINPNSYSHHKSLHSPMNLIVRMVGIFGYSLMPLRILSLNSCII
jgi:hypothetical protein